jgi:hypothetical protein
MDDVRIGILHSFSLMGTAGLSGDVPARVVALTQGVLTMFLARLNRVFVAMTLLVILFTGVRPPTKSRADVSPSKDTGVQVPKAAEAHVSKATDAQVPKHSRKPIRQVLQEAAKAVHASQNSAP